MSHLGELKHRKLNCVSKAWIMYYKGKIPEPSPNHYRGLNVKCPPKDCVFESLVPQKGWETLKRWKLAGGNESLRVDLEI